MREFQNITSRSPTGDLRIALGFSLILFSLTITACGSNADELPGEGKPAVITPSIDPNSTSLPNPSPDSDPATDPDPVLPPTGLFVPHPSDIAERTALYLEDGYGTVDVVRIDARTVTTDGVCIESDYSGCTFADVLSDINHKDDFKPRIDVHFKAADFADDGQVNNAELRQRGGSTRNAPQKSFRIKLDNKEALWRGERSLFLNKHPYEKSRIRNKVAFDLMSEIPHLLSSRTQFANLWIDNGTGPVDYGVFTHVESPGSNYLDKRGRSRNDRLYKTNFFRFDETDLRNVQVDADGKPLNKDLFKVSLDIESGDDHRMLVKMLEAFNDPTRSLDSVLDQYFNRNNVLTWMAVNLLLHQTDAVTHNFMLYNPEGSEIFYFLPWDYDGGFAEEIEPPAGLANAELQKRLYYGYARGVNSKFHNRYYRLPGMHNTMLEAADFLRENYLTDTNISEKAERAQAAVKPYLLRSPDSDYNTRYSGESAGRFAHHVANNHDAMANRFGIPMPPVLEEDPVLIGSDWIFSWAPAYDLTGDDISYELQISKTTAFNPEAILVHLTGIADASERVEQRVDGNQIPPGKHYVRVIARTSREPQRFWQVCSNVHRHDGFEYYGMEVFIAP